MTRLGIDIGGSGIKGAPVDIETGELTDERFRIKTPQPSTPEAVADVVSEIAAHFKLDGAIGITFPAVVQNGKISTASNVDKAWIGVDAEKMFSEKLGSPVVVLNDADAAGLAEMRFGAGKGRKGVTILLTLGTGIGSALFLDGKLLPNSELGHLEIRGKDAEERASEKVRKEKDLSWEKWGDRLQEYFEEMELLFSPNLFIIGGGVSKKTDKFLPDLQKKIRAKILPAEMQNEAGIIGAAWKAGGEEIDD